MTKNEIDRHLALAIGYPADRVRNLHGFVQVFNGFSYNHADGPISYNGWQRFDHTLPDVIWPIAERFNSFPRRQYNACEFIGWHCWAMCQGYGKHSNPATASALAVIAYVKSRRVTHE